MRHLHTATSDSGYDDSTRLMDDEWCTSWATEDDLESLAGLSPYERSMRLRDRTDPEEARW